MASEVDIVIDRLFFAGEATTRSTFATCHGALLTGRRAVGEIVARLRGTGGNDAVAQA